MRTKVSSITLLTGILSVLLCNIPSVQGSYNSQAAVDYAKEWDCEGCRNTDDYLVYDADCANFVSQCLIAGGLDLTACTDPEVVTDEKGCIISCTVLDRYLRWVGVNHDCRLVSEGEPEWLRAGDVIILACSPDRYQHAMIVANGEGANALYSGHSQDQEEVDFSELPKLLWDKYANDYCETTHINYYQIVQGQLVYFADANLKACVEAALGITDPTPTDMLALTELYCSDRGIDDLNGLEYATNLTSLGLKYNQISDISALSGLTNVEELWLGNNQIGDISALSGLTNLERLYINNNQINDISSLSGLMNLEMLYARNNQVSDISALSGLTNLAWVYLYHNQVSDISALSGLTNLNGLYLESNPLDQDAYDIYIPLIRENNPGIYLYYDPPVDHVLTVSKTGSGTIISSPAGINCGSDCSESYEDGTEVTLTATADDGWVLTDWDFENADINECQLCELAVLRGFDYNISVSCTVTMNRSIDAHITFERGGVIKVTKTGSGTVVSSPGGINCGCDCSEVFMGDSRIVTLTAIPAIGATFLGWEGDCSGTGPCVLDTSRHRNVTANFTQGGQFMLTVSKTGSGTIISSPAGIDCGSDCSETYEDGTEVTLTIEADSGWAITDADFSGSCNKISKQLFQLDLLHSPIPVYSLPLDIVEPETIEINFSPVGGEPPEKPLQAELAIAVIGADYLWGAKGWEGGRFLDASEIEDLDCSGLVFWSYNKAYGATKYQPCVKKDGMVEFPNPIAFEGANNQYHYNVEAIAKEDLPGDLLFFDADKRTPKGEWIEYGQDGRVDHVAMYVGTFQYEGEEYNVVEATPPWVKAARVDEVIARIRNLSGQDAFKGFGRVISVTMPLEEALTIPGLIIKDNCPVDLIVTDPEGFEVTTDIREVPDMIYLEVDTDGDSELEDVVLALKRKVGDYSIIVVPELGASPTDTYSLELIANGDTIILAEDVAIKDIPAQPYIIRSTETEIIPIITATIDFDPDTLNLKSKAQRITVYIELPIGHGYNVSMIDLGTLMLNGQVKAETRPMEIGDYDSDSVPDFMVKFDRSAVQEILEVGNEVEITVKGELTDGTQFEGIDTIRAIDKGKGKNKESKGMNKESNGKNKKSKGKNKK